MSDDKRQYGVLNQSDENRKLLQRNDKCDKYDYLAAVGCGAIGGIIDIFLIGIPEKSILGNWTDDLTDGAVKKFAKLTGWKPKEANKDNVASAIGFLERKYKVNYDQKNTTDVGGMFQMNTKNHHLMSLAHSPDIIGLFFSVLNQFTSTSAFLANGRLVMIKTETFELQGGNFIAKIFCGIANWFGHIMSDIAGSSGSQGRGIGVAAPFYELFQFCKWGKFPVDKAKQDLATIAERAFKEGYDFRFSMATVIPVLITDLSIKLIWALRRHFQYEYPVKECIPTMQHEELRVMLLFGNGTFCVMDGLDAGLRSGGNFLLFFMRLNLFEWSRFIILVLKEVCIRAGIADALQQDLDAFRRINEAVELYLHELEKIDIEKFEKETAAYQNILEIFEKAESEKQINEMLLETYDKFGFTKPWEGDFDDFMSDRSNRLVFE